jgi:carotenoid 1,2-hydratase
VGRTVRTEAPPREVRTFEDTPFYTRTAATTTIGGVARPTICESVDLDRFASPWVQALLPFRMPRFAR